jgi:HEAT repeat protein
MMPRNYSFVALSLGLFAACGPSRETVGLKDDLLSKNYEQRKNALTTLEQAKPSTTNQLIPLLIQDLRTANDTAALNAMGALIKIGAPASAHLVPLAEDKNNRMRFRVLKTLAGIRPFPQEALPAFTKAINDSSPETRLVALEGLGQAQGNVVGLTPNVLAQLKDENSAVRVKALAALAKWGPQATETVLFVIPQLKDKDVAVRVEAADALGKIAPRNKEAAIALAAAAHDPDESMRRNAVISLGAMDSADPIVITTLRKALRDPAESVRIGAERSLRKLNTPEALELLSLRLRERVPQISEGSLTERLLSQNPDMRDKAVARLRKVDGETKRAVVRLLVEVIELDDAELTALAAKAIAETGDAAIPNLIAGLKNSSAPARIQSAWALGLRATKSVKAIPALINVLETDQDNVARWTAAQALGRIGEPAKKALPVLKKTLREKDEALRFHSAEALGLITKGHNDAIDELGRIADFDESLSVRGAAQKALREIGTPEAEAILKSPAGTK